MKVSEMTSSGAKDDC